MDTNLAYKTNPRDQIPGLLMIALGWILFLTSALNYRAVSWFNYLFYGRLLAFISAVGLVFIIALNKNSKFKDTWFYTMCLGLQALHGILEGQSQTDFYSYTGLFYIIAALSTRCSLRDWLLKLFPLQILFLIAPLFFKSPQFFTSIAKFVDSFSLPVSGFIVGTIIVWINIQRFQTLIDNLRLKHELAESRHALLQKEKEKVQEIAFELEIAKNELIKHAENKAMVEVAAQVAHDIRSPLSALMMVIGMLKDLPKEKKELLLNATKRIDGIANDLLNKSKTPSEKTKSNDDFAKPYVVIKEIIDEKKILFSDKIGLNLYSEIQKIEDLKVGMTAHDLSRILSNLINNAIEAFENFQGTVTVAAKKGPNAINIDITDNGKGIPQEILEKIGVRGFSSGKEGTQSGSGLGVWSAKKIIEAAGGEFTISSKQGEGTQIHITLPTL